MKPRIAIFSLTGCEGCALTILELEDRLLELLGAVEIVNFREAGSRRAWDIDIAFVDGSVSTPADEAEIRRIRACCKTLVAVGACACNGGINTLAHHFAPSDNHGAVCGERTRVLASGAARGISTMVGVDYALPGCPVVKEEFLELVTCLLAGKPFRLPEHCVCVECKLRGNACLYEKGVVCLGPITRGGCAAICPSYGARCDCCRGIVHGEALRAGTLSLCGQHRVSDRELSDRLALFGSCPQGAAT